MRHSWLVLATLLICAGEAKAKRVTCACPTKLTLPDRGATVPLNAKIWQLGEFSGQHYASRTQTAALQGVHVIAPELTPNAPFSDDKLAVEFTTSGVRDDTPPAAPRDLYFSLTGLIQPSESRPIIALSAYAIFDDETALVRFDIRDGETGIVSLVTTPSRLYLCDPGFYLTNGQVEVEVRSIDIAGNESAPATIKVDVQHSLEADQTCTAGATNYYPEREHYRHRGHGFEIILFVLIIPGVFIAWIVIVIFRRLTAKRTPAEAISLLAAEAIVRRLLRWQVTWTAIVIAGTFAATAAIDHDIWILFVPWLFSTFAKLIWQRRALRLLDAPETDALRRGPWLVVTSLRDSVMVRASDSDFVAGKRSAIPTSVVQ